MKKPIITFTAFLIIIAGIMYGQEKTAALDNAKQVKNKQNAVFIKNKEKRNQGYPGKERKVKLWESEGCEGTAKNNEKKFFFFNLQGLR